MPSSREEDISQVVDAVRRTARELARDLPIRTREGYLSVPNLAYARCLDLLRSMIRLVDSGLDDAVGVVYRSLLEAGFSALYAQGGAERVEKLVRAEYADMCRLYRRLNAEPPAWEVWCMPFAALGWRVARPNSKATLRPGVTIAAVLRERSSKDYASLLDAFANDYRLESHVSEHASLSSVCNYARLDGDDQIEVSHGAETEPSETRRRLVHAALFTLLLAWMVYNTYADLEMAKIDRLKNALIALLI